MPGGSFSKRLLPTDRYCWSSENGKQEKLKENIKLPSFVWQWEHEWRLETTFEDTDLDDDVSKCCKLNIMFILYNRYSFLIFFNRQPVTYT